MDGARGARGTYLDSFRAEAAEQAREVRRRSLVDNLLLSNDTAATKATKGSQSSRRSDNYILIKCN